MMRYIKKYSKKYSCKILKINYQYKKNSYRTIKFYKNTQTGADEGTRTPTPLALVPKTSASTSSATSAYLLNNEYNSIFMFSLSSAFYNFIG